MGRLADYLKTIWGNNTPPAISETNLNKIENQLEALTDQGNSNFDEAQSNRSLINLLSTESLPANFTIGAYPITVTGTNAYTGTFSDLTYFTGLMINMLGVAENTGASTLNINGLGAKTINKRRSDGSLVALEAKDINGEAQLIYNGSVFVLMTDETRKQDLKYQRNLENPFITQRTFGVDNSGGSSAFASWFGDVPQEGFAFISEIGTTGYAIYALYKSGTAGTPQRTLIANNLLTIAAANPGGTLAVAGFTVTGNVRVRTVAYRIANDTD